MNRRAFTLLELLVAISVIVILVAIVASLGPGLFERQRVQATRGVIDSLDRMLEEYIISNGAPPPYIPEAYEGVPGERIVASGDAPPMLPEDFRGGLHPRLPDAAVFLTQAQGVGESDAIRAQLPEGKIVWTQPAVDGDTNPRARSLSVLDAWAEAAEWQPPYAALTDSREARTILYVHPSNPLAQELYGRCLNGRPYFMSAGPDRLYGVTNQFGPNGQTQPSRREDALAALEDNIYSYTPDPANPELSIR